MGQIAEKHFDAIIGHRIGISHLLKKVFEDMYSQVDGGADVFEQLCQQAITTMHGVEISGIPITDPEYAKQHALQSIEVFQSVPNEIRKRRGEPTKRPT